MLKRIATRVRRVLPVLLAGTAFPLFAQQGPAIKTNLLSDAVSILNVSVEVPIGQHWSVAGEYIFPWWEWNGGRNHTQLIAGNIEGRYGFGGRAAPYTMTGWFAGVGAGGGYYDMERNGRGRQGEFFTVGLSGGYAHSIGCNGRLRMEYSLSLGYIQSGYREYVQTSGPDGRRHLTCGDSGMFRWGGPTKVGVSLVWLFLCNARREGGAQ
jgi:hypothetical protein